MSETSENEKVFYNEDWTLREINPIHKKWYSLNNQVELGFFLMTEDFRESLEDILKKLNYEVNEKNLKNVYKTVLMYIKIILADIVNYLSEPFYEHFNKNYPIFPIETEIYKVPEKRNACLKAIKRLREDLFKVEKLNGSNILPKQLIDEFHEGNVKRIKEVLEKQEENSNFLRDPLIPIVLLGVDYSGIGIVRQLYKEDFPEEENLENQKESAEADYFLGVVAIATEMSGQLLEFGLKEHKKLSSLDRKLLNVIIEEANHRMCDLCQSASEEEVEKIHKQTGLSKEEIIMWRSPYYGEKQVENEHVFLHEIGGKRYGYNGTISKFVRERGPLYIGKLKILLQLSLQS